MGWVAKRGGGAETSKDADTMGLSIVGTVGSGYRGYRGIVGIAALWALWALWHCGIVGMVAWHGRHRGHRGASWGIVGHRGASWGIVGFRIYFRSNCFWGVIVFFFAAAEWRPAVAVYHWIGRMIQRTLLLFPSAFCICECRNVQCAHLSVSLINPPYRAIRRTRASGGLASLDSRGDERSGAVHVRPVAAHR